MRNARRTVTASFVADPHRRKLSTEPCFELSDLARIERHRAAWQQRQIRVVDLRSLSGAPGGPPASPPAVDTDTVSSTTPAEPVTTPGSDSDATATTSPAAAKDNPQPQQAEQSPDGNEPADDATATEAEDQLAEQPELAPANDNQPAVDLPATGTH